VPGQRCLDADLGRFGIAHLADHDHIRIGAHEAAHRGGEGPADLGVDLNLAQARLGDLDRILRGPDLALRGIQKREQ
jgi:hypothetical protein